MPLHPAENRGYRELYVTGRQAAKRLSRMALSLDGTDAREQLDKATESLGKLLDELGPMTARHDLYGDVAAQGGGANIGAIRGAVFDRFLERNQALRTAVLDVQHVVTLLGYQAEIAEQRGDTALARALRRHEKALLAYLATVSEGRGDTTLAEFCGSWERRMRRQVSAVRKAAVALGTTPDVAIEPLDPSAVGRAAHGAAWAFGTVGEWTDRQVARRRRG